MGIVSDSSMMKPLMYHQKQCPEGKLEAMNLKSSLKIDIVTIEPDIADMEILQNAKKPTWSRPM